MYKNYAMCRAAVLESAFTNTQKSRLIKMLFRRDAFFFMNLLPRIFFTIFVAPLTRLKFVSRIYLKMTIGGDFSDNQHASGFGSLIKFGCSDISVTNSCMAMELMGADGTRQDMGAEKFLRDAKLLQIYEGTNEVNKVNLFHTVAPHEPEIRIFQ
jgi:hypothetical protein